MAYEELEFDWLKELIHPALCAFYEEPHKRELVERNLHERTLVASIFCSLNSRFEKQKAKNVNLVELDVDFEYNRNMDEQKFLFNKCKKCDSTKCFVKEGNYPKPGSRHPSYPDLVIHKRGTNENNQVVIEFKKQSNTSSRDNDIAKLTFFTCQKSDSDNPQRDYQYKQGLFIELGESSYKTTFYCDAEKDAELIIFFSEKTHLGQG